MVWVVLANSKNIVSIEVYCDDFKYGYCLFSNCNEVMTMHNIIILRKAVVSFLLKIYIFSNVLNAVNLFKVRMRLVVGRGSDG